MKVAIVSGADSAFFDLLLGCIQSIRACPESSTIDICVFDFGMTLEQLAALRPLTTRIVMPGWDLTFDNANLPAWYKALIVRPHIPRHFQEYELLLWIDADAWLCDWSAAKLLLYAARFYGFAIVPELDRSYSHCYQKRPEVTANLHQTYLEGFGMDAAQRLATLPVINAGVFAMRRDVPFWNIWSEILGAALQRSQRFLTEQCALNFAIYSGRIRAHFLPSWCNWNCAHALPVLDPSTRQLLAPMLPHEPIGICHLTDVKRQQVKLRCTDHVTRQLSLTYPELRVGELNASASDINAPM